MSRTSVKYVTNYVKVWLMPADVRADFFTLRVRRSRGEMHIGHGRLSVCPLPHSHTTARTRM